MRILLAYSGGLDTSWLVARLAAGGHTVCAATVDCGGFTEVERTDLAARARALGAAEHRLVDARDELWQRVLRWLLAGNVRRGGTYPLSVGAERGIQAEVLARLARAEGFEALAHGCTAAGNDQVRFEAALRVVAPELEVLAPIRDERIERSEQVEFLRQRGLPLPPAGGRYSVNAGLWGLSIGGGETLDSREPLPEEAWVWTRGGGGQAAVRVDFEKGVPVAVDGERTGPVELVERLNRAAGALGVGRGYHLGDTLLGIKGRIGYEAPAAEVLLCAHRELEKLVLTEEQRFWKDQLGEVYGRRLHAGLLFDPVMRDIEALFASTQERVSGTVRLRLAGGRALVEGLESPFSLLAQSDARYGERPAAGAEPRAAMHLGRILAEPGRLFAAAGRAGGGA